MQNNFFDGKIFYDIDDYWNQFQCEYHGCENKAVGRVKSENTFMYELGYMKVCDKHLKEFKTKYGIEK
jgi:hypothetical protein